MQKTAIGIDLGGTRIKAVIIDAECKILCQLYQPTYDGDDKIWKSAVMSAVNELQNESGTKPAVIGISAPGIPNKENTTIAFMPGRLEGLENFVWTKNTIF